MWENKGESFPVPCAEVGVKTPVTHIHHNDMNPEIEKDQIFKHLFESPKNTLNTSYVKEKS
jgi:hypothetical protein